MDLVNISPLPAGMMLSFVSTGNGKDTAGRSSISSRSWHVFHTSFIFCFCFCFALRGPLTAVAPPTAEHRLWTRRLSGHGSRAQPLHGMWDLPGLRHEPVSPASAGSLSTTAPPGKPLTLFFNVRFFHLNVKRFSHQFYSCFSCILLFSILHPTSRQHW